MADARPLISKLRRAGGRTTRRASVSADNLLASRTTSCFKSNGLPYSQHKQRTRSIRTNRFVVGGIFNPITSLKERDNDADDGRVNLNEREHSRHNKGSAGALRAAPTRERATYSMANVVELCALETTRTFAYKTLSNYATKALQRLIPDW